MLRFFVAWPGREFEGGGGGVLALDYKLDPLQIMMKHFASCYLIGVWHNVNISMILYTLNHIRRGKYVSQISRAIIYQLKCYTFYYLAMRRLPWKFGPVLIGILEVRPFHEVMGLSRDDNKILHAD